MKNNEIDIIGIFSLLISFYRKFKLLILTFFLIGIIVGVTDFYFRKNFYKTDFIVTSPGFNSRLIVELARPIQFYFKTGQTDSIMIHMNMPLEAVASVKSVDYDTTIVNIIKINLEVYNSDYLNEIQSGFVKYFNSLPFVKNNVTKRKNELNRLITAIDNEIKQLDSLQNLILRNLSDCQGSVSHVSSGLFSESVSLHEKKQELMVEQSKMNDFQLIRTDSILIPQKSLSKNLLIFGFIGFFVGIIVSILLNLRKIAISLLNEK